MNTRDAVPGHPEGNATELTHSQCWSLVRQAVVGRLAVVHDGAPDIFPVNFAVDHGSLVFRTGSGSLFRSAVGAEVAFEVDGYDVASGTAWSVVVKGTAHELVRLDDALEAMELPIHPWHSAPKPRFIRLEPDDVTGRRFAVLGGHMQTAE